MYYYFNYYYDVKVGLPNYPVNLQDSDLHNAMNTNIVYDYVVEVFMYII